MRVRYRPKSDSCSSALLAPAWCCLERGFEAERATTSPGRGGFEVRQLTWTADSVQETVAKAKPAVKAKEAVVEIVKETQPARRKLSALAFYFCKHPFTFLLRSGLASPVSDLPSLSSCVFVTMNPVSMNLAIL